MAVLDLRANHAEGPLRLHRRSHEPIPARPLQILRCESVPGMRVELWGASRDEPFESFATGGRDVDALRFHLTDCSSLRTWADGVPEILPPSPAGSCSMLDYWPRRRWRDDLAEMIVFRIPREALADWAQANGFQRFDGLQYQAGAPFFDPVLANLALAMHRSLTDRRAAAAGFTAMIFDAVLAHLIKIFSATSFAKHRGGLANWQIRAVQRFVANEIQGSVQLTDLAAICGLSVSYFVKAFTATTGSTPRQWLISRRIERARGLLQSAKLSLAEVADSCGFSDQSHFTRTFTKTEGVSPGAWRKQFIAAAPWAG